MLIRVSLQTGTGADKATPDIWVNVIATVQVPLTGSHSPSSCSLHSFCQVIRQCGQDIEVGQDLEAAWPAKLGHCCQLCSQDFGQRDMQSILAD